MQLLKGQMVPNRLTNPLLSALRQVASDWSLKWGGGVRDRAWKGKERQLCGSHQTLWQTFTLNYSHLQKWYKNHVFIIHVHAWHLWYKWTWFSNCTTESFKQMWLGWILVLSLQLLRAKTTLESLIESVRPPPWSPLLYRPFVRRGVCASVCVCPYLFTRLTVNRKRQ